jgi:hypothetical protein
MYPFNNAVSAFNVQFTKKKKAVTAFRVTRRFTEQQHHAKESKTTECHWVCKAWSLKHLIKNEYVWSSPTKSVVRIPAVCDQTAWVEQATCTGIALLSPSHFTETAGALWWPGYYTLCTTSRHGYALCFGTATMDRKQ